MKHFAPSRSGIVILTRSCEFDKRPKGDGSCGLNAFPGGGPEYLQEIRGAKLALIAKTEAAVTDRLIKEITYWDHRAKELKR
ncbi:MAG: hypothetical protein ACFCUG_13710 [Thiotrichales bacterium]